MLHNCLMMEWSQLLPGNCMIILIFYLLIRLFIFHNYLRIQGSYMKQYTRSLKLSIIIFILIVYALALKHGSKAQSQNAPEPNHTSASSEAKSDKPSTATTVAEKTTTSEKTSPQADKKQQKQQQTKKQEASEDAKQKPKPKADQQDSGDEETQKYIIKIQAAENQYVAPLKVAQNQYNLGLYYGEEGTDYGKMPSWMFTSITDTHELCDAADDCQELTKYVSCQNDKKKGSSPCVEDGKAKYSSDFLSSKKKAKITYENDQRNYTGSFVSPSKAVLKYESIGQNEISGFLNLALDSNQKFKNNLMLSDKTITILQKDQFKEQFDKQGMIDLSKTGLLSLSSSKDLYLRTQNKNEKPTNNLKQTYQKIRIGFNRVDTLMAVTKNMMVAIKNILKKQYFGDRCKIKDYQITCSSAPVQNITKLSFCRDKDGNNCIALDILGMVIKQIKANKTFKFLIEQNREDSQDNTIVFYPQLAEHFQIYASQGLVRGVLRLNQTQLKKEDSRQKKQNLKDESSDKISQETQEVNSQKTQQKSKQQQEDQDVTGDKAKKQKKKVEDEDEDGDKKKEEQQDKEDRKDQDESEDKDEQEQVPSQTQDEKQKKKNKSSGTKRPTPKHIESSLAQKGSIEQQQKYSKGILFFTFIYGSIFIAVIVAIKWKAKQSAAAAAIDRFLEITWYAVVNNYFARSQGYNPPTFDEDEAKGNEQVDRSDSVAVGYTYKQGKELFWETNSIEGF